MRAHPLVAAALLAAQRVHPSFTRTPPKRRSRIDGTANRPTGRISTNRPFCSANHRFPRGKRPGSG